MIAKFDQNGVMVVEPNFFSTGLQPGFTQVLEIGEISYKIGNNGTEAVAVLSLWKKGDEIVIFAEGIDWVAQRANFWDNWINQCFPNNDWSETSFITEGVDQTRGWFYTLHAIASMNFDSIAYKNVVSNGLVLDKNGKKMSKRLGNAVDPFETMKKYGADATRWYMISNANPWDNLKFDVEGIEEVRRKFFGTLYNTYSFFSLYANIDKFAYVEEEIALAERPEIDRWILSEMNSLMKKVESYYDDYEPTKAARAIQNFVGENLSNLYVRLCRRRFWKGEY